MSFPQSFLPEDSSQCSSFVSNYAHISFLDEAKWKIEAKKKECDAAFDIQWSLIIIQFTLCNLAFACIFLKCNTILHTFFTAYYSALCSAPWLIGAVDNFLHAVSPAEKPAQTTTHNFVPYLETPTPSVEKDTTEWRRQRHPIILILVCFTIYDSLNYESITNCEKYE